MSENVNLADKSQLALWQSYCDKKMECESLVEEVERLRGERDELISVLRHAINGWDYEEVAHHCGVDSNTAARVIAMIEGEDNE